MILISQKIHAKEVDLTGMAEHFCGGGGERVGVLTSDFKLGWGIEETLLLVSLYFLEKLGGGGGGRAFFPASRLRRPCLNVFSAATVPLVERAKKRKDNLKRVRSFGRIRIRIFDPRSLGSWCTKGMELLYIGSVTMTTGPK